MVSLSWTTRRQGGVTLVEVRVAADRARRVRLANCLDGPVWPPRRQGIPEAGWDEDGVEVDVPADGQVALGYATPADPADPPVEVARTDPVAPTEGFGGRADVPDIEPTPAGVVRALGDPRPPRDAVPAPDADRPGRDGPATVEAWLEAVEARLDSAADLAAADTLPEATDALGDAGGLDAARRLADGVERDRRALERIARRIVRLRERADAVEVPVATYERLA